MSLRGQPPEVRFWAKVNKTGECWLWTGAHTSRGYGVITINYQAVYAHRYALELAGHPASPGQLVCHHCDTPLCVRADHLFVGTAADNATDMVAKGRSDRSPKSAEHRRKIGEGGRAFREAHPFVRPPTCGKGHPVEGRKRCHACQIEGLRRRYWRDRGMPVPATKLVGPRAACPAGHPYDAVNTYTDRTGGRHCRTCRSAALKRFQVKSA